ncbi:MAG: dihydropyrimidinase [Firmicutes bacterium]|nr:dihydropyrimidinase [Bacillota bacterium]
MLIQGGYVVTPGGVLYADVAIAGGRIQKVGPALGPERGTQVVDARGLVVMPGIIDAHTHFELHSRGTVTADDFRQGSISAACGGVTTFIDFADAEAGLSFTQAADRRRQQAEGRSAIDFSLHLSLNDAPAEKAGELAELVQYGISSLKVFTTYRKEGYMLKPGQMEFLLQESRRLGALVQVHAEDNGLVESLTERHLAEGKTEPRYHPVSRPNEAERKAIAAVIQQAEKTQAPVYFVHISTEEGLAEIKQAQARGMKVWAETCPQYLLLDQSLYEEPQAQRFILTPPLREKKDNAALWQGLVDGVLATVATDHCAFSLMQKGQATSFVDTLPGLPGVETLLPLLYSEGVGKERFGLERLVELLSTNPARIFGLYPRKGALLPGSDADLVLFDPEREVTLTASALHSAAGYTPYEGFRVRGYPVMTILRGQLISQEGSFVGEDGAGRFIPARATTR